MAYNDAVSGRTPDMVGFSRGNRFCRNIVVDCKDKVLHHWTNWTDRTVAQSDYNLFFRRRRRGANISTAAGSWVSSCTRLSPIRCLSIRPTTTIG